MKVKTNKAYEEKFGRIVFGTLIHVNDPNNPICGVVLWEHQEGKVIPEHQGSNVLMMIDDLESVIVN